MLTHMLVWSCIHKLKMSFTYIIANTFFFTIVIFACFRVLPHLSSKFLFLTSLFLFHSHSTPSSGLMTQAWLITVPLGALFFKTKWLVQSKFYLFNQSSLCAFSCRLRKNLSFGLELLKVSIYLELQPTIQSALLQWKKVLFLTKKREETLKTEDLMT